MIAITDSNTLAPVVCDDGRLWHVECHGRFVLAVEEVSPNDAA